MAARGIGRAPPGRHTIGDIVTATGEFAPSETAMNWRDDLCKAWVAASIVWAAALHLMIAIEKPDWSSVIGSEIYWLFLIVPPLAMGLLILGTAWIITRFPKLPK